MGLLYTQYMYMYIHYLEILCASTYEQISNGPARSLRANGFPLMIMCEQFRSGPPESLRDNELPMHLDGDVTAVSSAQNDAYRSRCSCHDPRSHDA